MSKKQRQKNDASTEVMGTVIEDLNGQLQTPEPPAEDDFTALYQTETDLYEAMYETWAMETDFFLLVLDIFEDPGYHKNKAGTEKLLNKLQPIIDKWGLPQVIAVLEMWIESPPKTRR